MNSHGTDPEFNKASWAALVGLFIGICLILIAIKYL